VLFRSAKPISASPDLGKVSFTKKAIIVDLGLIGDPMLGDLTIKNPGRVADFLNDYVAPDIVESHGFWSCRYSDFLESVEFRKNYRLSYTGVVSSEFNFPPQTSCPFDGEYRIWTRIIPEVEFNFARTLNSVSHVHFPKIIEKEVVKCSQETKELKRCQYVYRGVLREIARVNTSGISTQIFDSLRQSPTFKLDKIRLEKQSNWAQIAEEELLGLIA
jgi:hypothetical protein